MLRLFTRHSFRSSARYFNSDEAKRFIYGVVIVPHQEAFVVERFGKFSEILAPGIHFRFPFINRIAAEQVLKEKAVEISNQSAISSDNVVLQINGVLYVKVYDAYAATYGVEDIQDAITQLAQTTMRSEIGKISLDNVFKDREILNYNIVTSLGKAAEPWGIQCLRYEIKDIDIPPKIQLSMQLQVEAERKKRAAILESEGLRAAEINQAEAHKQRAVLESEGVKIEKINQADGEAKAMLAVANAKAESLKMIADAICGKNGGNAVQMLMAEKYIHEFGKIADQNNTLVLSSSVNDVSAMVAQAMAIYKNVGDNRNETKQISADKVTSPKEQYKQDVDY